MSVPRISINMTSETKSLLKEVRNLLTVGELSFSAGIAADIIAEESRRLAPEGETGNLKRGIISRGNKEVAQFGSVGAAYVGVDYRIAPHAHLVEYGTSNRRYPKNKGKLVFYIDGKKIVVDSVAPMPQKPFMRPAIETQQKIATVAIETDLATRITKRLNKNA